MLCYIWGKWFITKHLCHLAKIQLFIRCKLWYGMMQFSKRNNRTSPMGQGFWLIRRNVKIITISVDNCLTKTNNWFQVKRVITLFFVDFKNICKIDLSRKRFSMFLKRWNYLYLKCGLFQLFVLNEKAIHPKLFISLESQMEDQKNTSQIKRPN